MPKLIGAVIFILFGVQAAAAFAQPFTDAGGRRVEVPDIVFRAMPASVPAALLIHAVATDKLTNWVEPPSADGQEFLSISRRGLPSYGRLLGLSGSVNTVTVMMARPDVIIDAGPVSPAYVVLADRIQAETGVPYILIDGDLGKTAEGLRLIGKLLGEADRGEALATYADHVLAGPEPGSGAIPARRIYYARGDDGLQTGGAGSAYAALIAVSGAANVGAEAGAGLLVNTSPGQLSGWNPDMVVAQNRVLARLIRGEPGWAGLAAVRGGAVHAAPALPFGSLDPSAGVNRLFGALWLRSLLTPGSRPEGDVEMRRFLKLFYGLDLAASAPLYRQLIDEELPNGP